MNDLIQSRMNHYGELGMSKKKAPKKAKRKPAPKVEVKETNGHTNGTEVALEIEDGCITNLAYQKGSRYNKNWVARVTPNPESKYRADREFFGYGKGPLVELPEDLSVGDYVEMCSKFYNGTGKAQHERLYFQVETLDVGALGLTAIDRPY